MESSQGTSEIRRQQTVECRDRQRGMQDGSNGERHAGMSDDAL